MRGSRYTPPTPITRDHASTDFNSDKPPLDEWLRAHALDYEGKASRTFIVTPAGGKEIIAFYTLAAGNVLRKDVPCKQRQDLPDPVPVMVLGRLAVDRRHHGNGLGKGLLRDAIRRTLSVSQNAGIRSLLVHAIDDEAINFYAKYGFQRFPTDTRTMMLMTETMADAL